MFDFCKGKAKARLELWKTIRIAKEKDAAEKLAIKMKLMERYDLPLEVHETFWAYRGDDEIYPYCDEDLNDFDYKVGDIVPFKRRGELVFFYKITGGRRKFGDYGWSDYATFYDLTYNHYEKLPMIEFDPKKSLKVKWKESKSLRKRDDERILYGYIQGIRICVMTITKHQGHRVYNKCEMRYIKMNFNHRTLPNYYDQGYGITEAKKDVQNKVNHAMKNGGVIQHFYVAPKLKRRK
jgi:hypothetical protein